MTCLQANVRRAVLLLTLCCAALCAGPAAASTYHVTIDTRALAGQSGYVDFLMLGLGGAAPVEATIENFSGSFATGAVLVGDASGGIAGGVTLGNGDGWNEFAKWASFGGVFAFDVMLAGGGTAGDGTNLGIALLDGDWNYLGLPGDVVTFALQPGEAISVTAQAGVASVVAVPEPSSMLLAAGGLALLVAAMRRRVTGATPSIPFKDHQNK